MPAQRQLMIHESGGITWYPCRFRNNLGKVEGWYNG